jgi:hypothetical protein
MAFTINYNDREDNISVLVEGTLSHIVFRDVATEIAKIIQETGCTRVINNFQHAKVASLALDIYHLPSAAQQAGVSSRIKRALVVGDKGLEFFFLLNVFKTQGEHVEIFVETEDAKKWLYKDDNSYP